MINKWGNGLGISPSPKHKIRGKNTLDVLNTFFILFYLNFSILQPPDLNINTLILYVKMKFKVIHNKKNNQLFIFLSRKKLKLSKDKVPRFIRIKKMKVMD